MISSTPQTGMSALAAGHKTAAAAKMMRTSLDVAAQQGAAAIDLIRAADMIEIEGQAIAAAGAEIARTEQVGQIIDLIG